MIAERIRSVVERLEIVHGARALGTVTVSIGICYASDAQKQKADAFFETADRALYDAKDAGRNRVVLGTSEPHARIAPPAPTASRRTKRVDDHILSKPSGRATRADDVA